MADQTKNKSFNITSTPWPHAKLPQLLQREPVAEPFHIVSSSFVRDMTLNWDDFWQDLRSELQRWTELVAPDQHIALGAFPEYFWRTSDPEEVLALIRGPLFRYIQEMRVLQGVTLVLGTLELTVDSAYGNYAIVMDCSPPEKSGPRLAFVPKTKILQREQEAHMVRGPNPGRLATWQGISFQVLVCADLWEAPLIDPDADLLIVPAWTATAKGNRANAALVWRSLGLTRSKEFAAVVVVSDHAHNFAKTDVAGATAVWDPCVRVTEFPRDAVVPRTVHRVDLAYLKCVRRKWLEKGTATNSLLNEIQPPTVEHKTGGNKN